MDDAQSSGSALTPTRVRGWGVVLAGLAARHLSGSFDLSKAVGALATSNIVSIAAWVLLFAVPLYLVARRVRTVED